MEISGNNISVKVFQKKEKVVIIMRETVESFVMMVEELDEVAQEQLLNRGFKLEDEVLLTSYIDEYDNTCCIILPMNK